MLTATISGVVHAYDITDNRPEELKAVQGSSADSAPTLVFIHGWLLSKAYWEPIVADLSQHYRCLTYDLRGFGDSEAGPGSGLDRDDADLLQSAFGGALRSLPSDRIEQLEKQALNKAYRPSPYSLAAYACDVKQLLDQLEIDRAWLLGHSLGGSIALWAAYLYPKAVTGVVCINAGGGIYIAKEFEKFRAAGQQIVKYRPDWLQNLPLLPRVFSRSMVRRPLDIRWGRQRLADFIRADEQAAKGSLLETTTLEEVHLLPQLIGLISQPVHFITATEDGIMPPRYVRYLASFHPQFVEGESVTELSDCGHMSMVEQPQAVTKVIRSVIQ